MTCPQQYLPNEEPKNLEATLERLFSGDNFHFGNPVDTFVSNLLGIVFHLLRLLYNCLLQMVNITPKYANIKMH